MSISKKNTVDYINKLNTTIVSLYYKIYYKMYIYGLAWSGVCD